MRQTSGGQRLSVLSAILAALLVNMALQGCTIRRDNSADDSTTLAMSGPSTLATLAGERGIRFGTFFFDPDGHLHQEIAVGEFNLYTLPVFITQVWPSKDSAQSNALDFHFATDVADAAPPNVVFKIPAIIWCGGIPDGFWLKDPSLTGSDIRNVMTTYLSAVIGFFQQRYPGRIVAWDIVNEPISFSATNASCPWHKIGLDDGSDHPDGYSYIQQALTLARNLVVDGKLYINNFGAEAADGSSWSERMGALLDSLKAQQAPLDGVGLQGHFMVQSGDLLPPNPACSTTPRPSGCSQFPPLPAWESIAENLRSLGNRGLETMITEADVSVRDADFGDATVSEQAREFRGLLHACLAVPSCKAFSTWGVGDKDSWIPQNDPSAVGWGHPLLFDSEYHAKPSAYGAMVDELTSTASTGT
jgi:endo-1,4-beta-xylanase